MNSRPHPYQGCALPLSYHGIENPERARYLKARELKTPLLNERGRMSSKKGKQGEPESREDRLKAALRANLRRRKAAARKSAEPENGTENGRMPQSDDTSSN